METNVRYTIVGAFVLILLVAVAVAVIWLSAGFNSETYILYQVDMKESVSGLTVDAAVEFNGVNVGTVKSIGISRKDPKLVELLLRVRNSTPITGGTRATMNMRGLTGVTFMALQDKGTNDTPLKVLPGEEYPIIKTVPSLLTRFDIALTQLNDSIRDVSVAVRKLLSEDNMTIYQDILKNIRVITRDLSPFLKSGVNTLEVFTNQTLPITNQALSSMENIMDNVSSLTAEIKQNPSILIRGKSLQPLGPGEK